jgi:hypothetical protein
MFEFNFVQVRILHTSNIWMFERHKGEGTSARWLVVLWPAKRRRHSSLLMRTHHRNGDDAARAEVVSRGKPHVSVGAEEVTDAIIGDRRSGNLVDVDSRSTVPPKNAGSRLLRSTTNKRERIKNESVRLLLLFSREKALR